MLEFKTDGMVVQSFPFPKAIMDYIFENLQPQHLVKLYPCCKLFYAKYGQPIIQHLVIVDDGEHDVFDFTKTVVCRKNSVLTQLADFWISGSLIDRTQTGIFPSFTNCTIKKLELNKYILWEDFELLTKSGNIEEMQIVGVNDENGYVSVEEILAHVPNATSIEISETFFIPTTCEALVLLNHKAKIANLVLRNVTPLHFCNFELFTDFVLKNSNDQCYAYIDFKMFPEVDDLSRKRNAVGATLGDMLRNSIARRLKDKEWNKKFAVLKNKRFRLS